MTARAHSEVELAHRLGLPTVAALNRAVRDGRVPPHDHALPQAGRVWLVPEGRDEMLEWLGGRGRTSAQDRLRQRAEAL